MAGLLNAFPPVIDRAARVLILGSMPGAESLRRGRYYAHPRNAFWPIMTTLFDASDVTGYEEKKQLLVNRGIALWDVIGRCRREGSLDQNIRDEEVNDFAGLFTDYSAIRHVFCNGAKAYRLFLQLVGDLPQLRVTRLPSTSPAHAIPFEEKLSAWKVVREALEAAD